MISKKYKIIIVTLAAILVISVIFIAKSQSNNNDSNVKASAPINFTNSESAQNIDNDESNALITLKQFTLPNCPACTEMEIIIDELKSEYSGKANIIVVDANKNYEEAKKYKIMYTPTQVFFDKDGKVLTRHVGYIVKDELVKIFEKYGVTK